jgi:Mor family transcriptional regulator
MIVDATPEYLLNVVDEETAIKIWESLGGLRIYFKSNTLKHYKIKKDFEEMKKRLATNADAITQLSYKYELTKDQIRKILRKDKLLFSENH